MNFKASADDDEEEYECLWCLPSFESPCGAKFTAMAEFVGHINMHMLDDTSELYLCHWHGCTRNATAGRMVPFKGERTEDVLIFDNLTCILLLTYQWVANHNVSFTSLYNNILYNIVMIRIFYNILY